MPRSCPPLRSDEVGWHGRRVRTRLRLILERVFWFVNGRMSQMFVGPRAPPQRAWGGQFQIPVFTGMTGFGAALRVVGKNDVANRRAVYGPTLERGLLKQALKTRPYERIVAGARDAVALGDGRCPTVPRRDPRSGSGMTGVWRVVGRLRKAGIVYGRLRFLGFARNDILVLGVNFWCSE